MDTGFCGRFLQLLPVESMACSYMLRLESGNYSIHILMVSLLLQMEMSPIFDGGSMAYVGYSLLGGLLLAVTCGLAYPWVMAMIQKWDTGIR